MKTFAQVNGHAAIAIEDVDGNQLVQLQSSVLYRSQGQAIALKNASNINVRDNVLLFSNGHAISVAGSSSGNVMAENVVMGCLSNSLLSASDQTPAGLYATNWNNTFRLNYLLVH